MPRSSPIAFDLALDGGALALDATGDLARVEGERSLRQRLLLAMLTTPGTIPYHPEDGAGAAAAEGGPALDAPALARRVRTQVLRDPDVLRVTETSVNARATGSTEVSVRLTSRAAPTAEQLLSLRIPR